MKILGINHSNDAAAALVVDGRVIAASQEERFTRLKHDPAFPDKAIDFCLKTQGLKLADLDAVAFFWNPGIHAEAPQRRLTNSVRHHLEYLYGVPARLISRLGEPVSSIEQTVNLASGRSLPIHYLTHHLCHAAAAFFTSPFDDAAILTADGYGERQSTTIYRGRGSSLELLAEVDFPHSIGSFYAALTDYLGFRANSGEGKVMGLASYGKGSDYVGKLRKLVSLTPCGFELDLSYFEYFHERPHRYSEKLVSLLGPPRAPESAVDERHEDIAFALQTVTEEAMLHLARVARELTGAKNLCVAGGVALNCVANGRLMRETDFEKFFFYPAAGDTGTSVGAALVVEHLLNKGKRSMEVASEYLGQGFTLAQVRTVLDRGQLRYHALTAPELTAARMLADGCIVAWFQGRAEFGPRALGNRSIVADPRRKDMKDSAQRHGKIPRTLPALRPVGAGTILRQVLWQRRALAVHVARLPDPARDDRRPARHHPRRRHRARADRERKTESPLLSVNPRIRPPHRRGLRAEHVLQHPRRAHHQHRGRGHQMPHDHRAGRALRRGLPGRQGSREGRAVSVAARRERTTTGRRRRPSRHSRFGRRQIHRRVLR
jgi:carbamoyltransferase